MLSRDPNPNPFRDDYVAGLINNAGRAIDEIVARRGEPEPAREEATEAAAPVPIAARNRRQRRHG